MSTLTITHTHEAGTLIEGTSRGDGTAEVLKARRWRFSRVLGGWYVPRSRDTRANRSRIEATRLALVEAGHVVAVEIDDTRRDAATVEADRIEREAERAERKASQAERAAERSAQAESKSQTATDALPWGGQPILVGHHSETKHRRALDRAHSAMGASIEADKAAAHAQEVATRAAEATASRYEPRTVAIKIDNTQKKLKDVQRQIEGSSHNFGGGYIEVTPPARGGRLERLQEDEAALREEVEFWQGIRAAQVAEGQAQDYSRENIKKGGLVQLRGSWYVVKRANPKTVTAIVGTLGNYGKEWTLTYRYAEITGYREPKE